METNEELITEARLFASRSPLGKPMARELDKAILTIRRLADALEAAITEWEYSVGFNDPEYGWVNDTADIHDSYEDARSDYNDPNWMVEDRVVRRRKAGPWLPVEGEST